MNITSRTRYNAAELLRVFFINKGEVLTRQEAIEQANLIQAGSTPVSDAFASLVDSGRIERTARGLYTLA